MNDNLKRPTLGIMPKKFWEDKKNTERFNEVCRAIMERYQDNGIIPIEWIEEYNELLPKIKHLIKNEDTTQS